GPYSLLRLLGRGGMGEVYLAQHRLLKRPCAVKLIHPELSSDPHSAARFEREVQAVTALSHLNTVRVYDYGQTEDGTLYYVMEYLEGPELEALVGSEGPLAPGPAVRLGRRAGGGPGAGHAPRRRADPPRPEAGQRAGGDAGRAAGRGEAARLRAGEGPGGLRRAPDADGDGDGDAGVHVPRAGRRRPQRRPRRRLQPGGG